MGAVVAKMVWVYEVGKTNAPLVAYLAKETDKSYMFTDFYAQSVVPGDFRTWVGTCSSKNDFIVCDTLTEAWTYTLKARTEAVKQAKENLESARRDAHDALLALEAAQEAGL
jgi:hypothetical protein